MSTSAEMQATPAPGEDHEERHASWTELFFDLVAVAGVAMLAHPLHHPTPVTLGFFVVGFVAFWLIWTTYMLYGNFSGASTSPYRLVRGMFGLATMAAAVPGVAEWLAHDPGHHPGGHGKPGQVTAFVLAYVITRWMAASSWRRGDILVDWPIAQQVTGAIPWLVSLWAPGSWTLALWALGLAVDVVIVLATNGTDLLEHARERASRMGPQMARHQAQEERRKAKRAARDAAVGRTRPDRSSDELRLDADGLPMVEAIGLEASHLSERLSLFVIIVLGEAIMQTVVAASEQTWDWVLLGSGSAVLLVLTGLFALSILGGFAGVPLLQPGLLSVRVSLCLHAATSASLVVAAAAIGGLVSEGAHEAEPATRWLLGGAIAVYFALGVLAFWLTGRVDLVRLAAWLVLGTVVPLLLAAFAHTSAVAYAWCFALLVQVLYRMGSRRGDPQPS